MRKRINSHFAALAVAVAFILASSGRVSIVSVNSNRYNISGKVYTKSLKEDFNVINAELCQGVYLTSN
jgi:hypothetical protein